MKMLTIAFVFLLFANLTYAKDEIYKKTVDNLIQNYNSENYQEIFDSYSPEMQQALPLNKSTEFLKGLKVQLGVILTNEFVKLSSDNFATYKILFERAMLALKISVDNNNKINGMLFQAFEEESSIDNKTTNSLKNIPADIGELIFTNSKVYPNNTQLSIALIENGEVRYYGILKESDEIKPVDNHNKIFEIGSITKVFTSTVLADLVVKNKIDLNDNINNYYQFQINNNLNISFLSLANHTSGLERMPSNLDLSKVNMKNPYKDYSKVDIEKYLKDSLKFIAKPREKYLYSNLGAGLLGFTLGNVMKSDYKSLLRKNIFEKYLMDNSYTDKSDIKSQLVKGLDADGNETDNWDFDVLFGAGGIFSNVVDLSKFMIAHFDAKNKELALTRNPTFTINDRMKIGLGWHIIKSDLGNDFFWHNGGTGGYSSSIAMDISKKNGIIILSNVSTFNKDMGNIDNLCFEIMRLLEKK